MFSRYYERPSYHEKPRSPRPVSYATSTALPHPIPLQFFPPLQPFTGIDEQPSRVSTRPHTPTSVQEKEKRDDPLPDHCQLPGAPLPRLCFQFLCLASFGRRDLSEYWWGMAGEEMFARSQDRLAARLANINVVVRSLSI